MLLVLRLDVIFCGLGLVCDDDDEQRGVQKFVLDSRFACCSPKKHADSAGSRSESKVPKYLITHSLTLRQARLRTASLHKPRGRTVPWESGK